MTDRTREQLERLLETDGDAVDILSALTAEALDEIAVRHIPPATVARDVFRVWQINPSRALVLLAALGFPNEPQVRIAARCGVSVRTVKRTLAEYRGRLPWVDALADIRFAMQKRRRDG